MMPHRIIKRRDPSAAAACERWLGIGLTGMRCGAEMQLVVTRNPISGLPFEQLVVERCVMGHIATSQGVAVSDPSDIRCEGL